MLHGHQHCVSIRSCRLLLVASIVVLSGSLCACRTYEKCGISGCSGDAKITADVEALFHQYPELEPPNLVYVQTLDHVVYLTGQVNTRTESDTASSIALRVAGVKRVVNSINLSYQGK
jgi:osmotically-inducible protein OsmY